MTYNTTIDSGGTGSGATTGRVTEQAKQQGRQVVARAGQQAKSQLGTQKERAAGQLHGVVQDRR